MRTTLVIKEKLQDKKVELLMVKLKRLLNQRYLIIKRMSHQILKMTNKSTAKSMMQILACQQSITYPTTGAKSTA